MPTLNEKLNDIFAGYVVRKDLVKLVRGNAAVPSFVLEYLLGQNAATDNEEEIKVGIERVKDILAEHYVQRAESGLVRSKIKETGYQRIIDKVSVNLNERRDVYEASFENLGISQVMISSETVKQNQRLLVSGVWCIADLGYAPNESINESPYILANLKPIQLSSFDFNFYCLGRSHFSTDEWLDVVVRTIGLEPEMLGRRDKLFLLARFINYCERNYNFIELGPKGTGKSHVFSEFSPHGILISGGEVTPAKLFVNNSTGKIGLVGYWDCVAFDEFAGKGKRPKPDIVDIMKNYMANKSFSRGIEQVTAEASMAFIGNTSHDLSYMIVNSDLFDDLPAMYHDSAFIDRIHAYIPGWEMAIIRGEMFSSDYGFIVDYLAEALRHLRSLDYSGLYLESYCLDNSLSTRDKDGINKTFSGLMKILFPAKNATVDEMRELLEFAIEMRKRVKDQLYRIDETFERVEFSYSDTAGNQYQVSTLEEVEFARVYHSLDRVPMIEKHSTDDSGAISPVAFSNASSTRNTIVKLDSGSVTDTTSQLETGRKVFRENQRGVSFDDLFGAYLVGAQRVIITDPYVQQFYQIRNLVEFIETFIKYRGGFGEAPARIHLITTPDEYPDSRQEEYLSRLKEVLISQDIDFSWDIITERGLHASHIVTDTGWEILLDRGLDIYQRFDLNDTFTLENRIPELRRVKQFEVTYLNGDAKT